MDTNTADSFAAAVMTYPSQFGMSLLAMGLMMIVLGARLGQSKNLGMIPMLTWGFVTMVSGGLLCLGDIFAAANGQHLAQINGAATVIGTLALGMLVGLQLPRDTIPRRYSSTIRTRPRRRSGRGADWEYDYTAPGLVDPHRGPPSYIPRS